MYKVSKKDLLYKNLISDGKNKIYVLNNGSVLKILDYDRIIKYNNQGFSLERKINSSNFIGNISGIVFPAGIVYDNGRFIGYTMNYVDGITLYEWNENLSNSSRLNLFMYGSIFVTIEKIIRLAHMKRIIIPKLYDLTNIMIDKKGSLHFISYDSMQVGDDISLEMPGEFNSSSYLKNSYYEGGLFTESLDKRNLISLFFKLIFDIDLNVIGKYNYELGKFITLEDILDRINLTDKELRNKIIDCLEYGKDVGYIGQDIFSLAVNYKLDMVEYNDSNQKILKMIGD